MKRALSVLLAAVMLLTLVPTALFASAQDVNELVSTMPVTGSQTEEVIPEETPENTTGINFLTDASDVYANNEAASFSYADGKLEFTATEAGQEVALVLAEAANLNVFPYVDLAIESGMAFDICFNDANNGKWMFGVGDFGWAFTGATDVIPAGSHATAIDLTGAYTWTGDPLPENAALKQIIFIAKEAGTMTVSKCEMVTAPATTAPEETTTTVDETQPTKPPVLGTETKIDFFAYGDVFGDESLYTLEDGVFTFNATAADQEIAFVLNGEANLNVVPFVKLAIDSEIPFDIVFHDANNDKWMFAVGDFCYNFENNNGASNPLPAGVHNANFSLTGAYTWTGAPLPENAAVKQIIFIAKAAGKMTVNTCEMYDGLADVQLYPENTANPDWTVESLIADNAKVWIPSDPTKSGDSEVIVTYDAENGFMNFGNTNGGWPSASIEVNKSVEYATSGLYVDLSVLKNANTTLYVFFGDATPDEFEGAGKAYGDVLMEVSGGSYYGYVKLSDILPADSDVIDEYGNVKVSYVKVFATSGGVAMDPAVVVKALDLGYTVSTTTKPTTTTTTTTTKKPTTTTTTTTTKKLVINTQPKAAVVAKGKTAKVTVKATGDSVKYQWYVKEPGKTSYKAISGATKSSYSFTMKDAYSGRSLYVKVTDKHGKSINSSKVVLDQKVTITTQPKAGVFSKGKTAKVTVKAIGGGLKYQWYAKEPGAKTYKAISKATKASYSFTMANKYAGRTVYCVVKDKYGNSVKSKAVVLDQKVTITTQPKAGVFAKGKSAKVTVAAIGGGLKYKWYVKEPGAKSYKAISSATKATYKFTMANKYSGRSLYCVVTDKYGNSVKSKAVVLDQKVTIATQPKSVTVAKNKTAKVTVSAVGAGLKYKWYVKEAGAKSFKVASSMKKATYSAKMTAKNSGRQVYCVITDKYGNSVKTKTVTLKTKK